METFTTGTDLPFLQDIAKTSSPSTSNTITTEDPKKKKKGRPRKRGLGSRTRAAEKYRDYNNHIVMGKLELLSKLVFDNLDNFKVTYDLLGVADKARRCVCKKDYAQLAALTLEVKTAIFEANLHFATTSEVEYIVEKAPEFFEEQITFERVHYLTPDIQHTVDIFTPSVFNAPACDQVYCETCEPLSYDIELQIEQPLGMCIYAGPGTGKTFLLSKLPLEIRDVIYDTDHYRGNVAPRSIVLTNRPDVFEKYQGLKIAILSSKRTWLARCREKCGDRVQDTWYSDVLKSVYNCFIIASDKHLSDLFAFQGKGTWRGRPPRKRRCRIDKRKNARMRSSPLQMV